jgi:hypothetical protein
MTPKFSLLARSRLSALVVAMLISAVRPFRSSFPSSAISSRIVLRRTQSLSVSRAGQFELSEYVKTNFLHTSVVDTTTTRIKTVNPTFISLARALEEYSGDNYKLCTPFVRRAMHFRASMSSDTSWLRFKNCPMYQTLLLQRAKAT